MRSYDRPLTHTDTGGVRIATPAAPELVIVIGPGAIGQAIARRIGVGKTILLADLNENVAIAAAKTLQAAGLRADRLMGGDIVCRGACR